MLRQQELRKLPKSSDVSDGVKVAEGRVLEEVVRTEEGSILVVELLGLMVRSQKAGLQYGALLFHLCACS